MPEKLRISESGFFTGKQRGIRNSDFGRVVVLRVI
jgi:hypothetical protein